MKKYIHISLILFILTLAPSISFASIGANLKYGSRGQAVVELQDFLISKGFLIGQTTGNFYSLTNKAVIAYQKSTGLPQTGYVGPMTRTKINAELASITQTQNSQEILEAGTTTPVVTAQKQNKTFTLPSGMVVDVNGNIITPATQQQYQTVPSAPVNSQCQIQISQIQQQIQTLRQKALEQEQGALSTGTSVVGQGNAQRIEQQEVMDEQPFQTQLQSLLLSCDSKQLSATQYQSTQNSIVSPTVPTSIITNVSLTPAIGNISVVQPSQPISTNISNANFGGLSFSITNQSVNITSMRFKIASTNQNTHLTNMGLWANNLVAGPVDESITDDTITFNDLVRLSNQSTFNVTLLGRVSNVQNGDTISITTNPSTDWIVRGTDNGAQAVLPNTVITLNITIKGPTISISVPNQIAAQSVLAGNQGVTMASLIIKNGDAEPVRLSGVPFIFNSNSPATKNDLSNCQIYPTDATFAGIGSNSLNSGAWIVGGSNGGAFNSIGISGALTHFIFGNIATIPNNGEVTLVLKCDISASSVAGGSYQWSTDNNIADYSYTGDWTGGPALVTVNAGTEPVFSVSGQ